MTRAPYYLRALKYNSVVTAALTAGGSASWSHLRAARHFRPDEGLAQVQEPGGSRCEAGG
jgi:hypothetical protein